MTELKAMEVISEMILEMDYPNGTYHTEAFSEADSQKHLALYKAKSALLAQAALGKEKP